MPPPSSPQPHIFLSYASTDRERALAVADALEAAGVPVWIDRRGIAGGTLWVEEIARAVREAPALLVLCSAASVASRNVRQELQLAWDQDKPILPLLLEPVAFPDGVAYILHGRQWIALENREVSEWVPDVRQAMAKLAASSAGERRELAHPTASDAPQPATRLPVPPNALLGREQEVAALAELVVAERLVTLTGPGGTGKTRLAIAVAAGAARSFPDGIVFVDLAPVTDPAQVLTTIAQVCGVPDAAGRTLQEGLAAFFANKRALLLLDNFEQLLAGARAVADLLTAAPTLHLLITSRAPLRIRAEHEVAIPPLADTPAIRLFLERAQAANPRFAPTPDQHETVREICRRLDGLPLAIELAAARIRLLAPQALLARLEQRLPLLTGGARDLPARQQTLRDAIAWSYDLLSPAQQTLFRRLAVFAGGCTLEAAEAVGNHDGSVDVLNELTALTDMSLVGQETSGTAPRFRMLETIREFGLAQLAASHEESTVRSAHADYLLALTAPVRHEPEYFYRTGEVAILDVERANVRQALAWLDETGDHTRFADLANGASALWYVVGPASEGLAWMERAIAPGRHISLSVRAWCTHATSILAHRCGKLDLAERYGREVIARFAELPDEPVGMAWAMSSGAIAVALGGDYATAIPMYGEARRRFNALGQTWGEAMAVGNLAIAELFQGNDEQATEHLTAALDLMRSIGDVWAGSWILPGLAAIALRHGDRTAAVAALREAADKQALHNDSIGLAEIVTGLACVAAAAGDADRAARLFAAESAMRAVYGPTEYLGLLPDRERARHAAEAALGEAAFAAAWADGRSWSLARIATEVDSALHAFETPRA